MEAIFASLAVYVGNLPVAGAQQKGGDPESLWR